MVVLCGARVAPGIRWDDPGAARNRVQEPARDGVSPPRQDRPRGQRDRLRRVGDRRVVGHRGRRGQPARAARGGGRRRHAHRHRRRVRRRAVGAGHPPLPLGAPRRALLRPHEDRPPRAARRPRVHPGGVPGLGGPEPREPGHGHARPRPAPLPADPGLLHAGAVRGARRARCRRVDRELRRQRGEGGGGPQGAGVPRRRHRPDRVQRVPPASGRAVPRRGAAARRRRARASAARVGPAHRQADPRDRLRGGRPPPVQPPRRVVRPGRDVLGRGLRDRARRGRGAAGARARRARRSRSSRCAGS